MIIPKEQRIPLAVLALILLACVWLATSSSGLQNNDPCVQYSSKTEAQALKECVEADALKREAVYTEQLADFTALLVLFTIVLAGASIWQGVLTRQSINLARDEFSATQRPRIKILSIETIYSEFEGDVEEIDTGVDRIEVQVRIRFVNAGTADAITIEIGTTILRVEPDADLTFDKLDTKRTPLASGEEGTHLTRSRKYGHREIFGNVFDEQFFCVGYIIYEDAARRRRKTAFCWWKPSGSGDKQRWERVKDSPFDYAY